MWYGSYDATGGSSFGSVEVTTSTYYSSFGGTPSRKGLSLFRETRVMISQSVR